jgi:hypothetical protein
MSTLTRYVLLGILTSAGIAYASPNASQPAESRAQAPARVSLDGKFVRYLESPNRDIDGIMLEDGTVARFAPFKRMGHSALLRPGDSVHVEGDAVSGMEGPYLVHALVTRIDIPLTRGEIPPQSPTGPSASSARAHRAEKLNKATLKDNPRSPQKSDKPRGPSVDGSRRVNDVLLTDSTGARPRKKGRLGTIAAKVRDATTDKGESGTDLKWSRTEETGGP